MSIFCDSNVNITMYQGDTGNLIFTGLPKDRLYTGYFAVNDEETGAILKEKSTAEYNKDAGSAIVTIDSTFSDDLPVGEWTYSFKLCYGTIENTVLPGLYIEDGKVVQKSSPAFTVLEKRVEGF